jgi:N-acetylneuraminic acid mutarotase
VWLIGLVALAVVGLIVVTGSNGGDPSAGRRSPTTRSVLVAHRMQPLPTPISAESVVATKHGLLILGGLDSSSNSASGAFLLDASTGELSEAGSLTGPLHDSAATLLGERALVFGGGTETSTDAVQALAAPGGIPAPETEAEVVGELPTVRSDLSAVTIGGTAYVLGGYDGSETVASVLATPDGSSFHQVAKLPVPSRYLAVATIGGRIYAFGGETVNGSASDAIQEIDVEAGTARIVGHLAAPISHASAVSMAGSIYVIGGEDVGTPTSRIWRFDPATKSVSGAGRLPEPVSGGAAALVGSSAYLIGGMGNGETPLSGVLRLSTEARKVAVRSKPAAADKPFSGRLMIADRGNDRLLVVNAQKRVLWRFPSKAHPAPPGGFYFPDDAFFTHGGTQIISNEEQDERIVQLSYPSGKLLWSYGHPGVTGSEPGYLHEPDDAYLLKDGNVSVADAQNCRVLLISPAKRILKEFGSPESCSHEPPHLLGSPNGDTPLANGDILVSEVNGSYIDEITPDGRLVWSVQLPIEYPSDPQQLGPNRYLVADYTKPGGIYEFNRAGKIRWSYSPRSGNRMLNHPSLAERLPNGLIATNDDYRDRVVIIDPKTKKIVWQYGVTGKPGTGPNHLHIPDGFDLLAPNGTTPTHPFTG